MDAQPDRFRLQLIGPFGLFDPQGRRIEISSKKGVAMLALLAAAPEGRRARAWLQTMLWGSRGQVQAQGSFRRELSNLTKALELAGAEQLLSRDGTRVALLTGRIDIDIVDLAARGGLASPALQGEFLEGIDLPDCDEFEAWLRDKRKWCHEVVSQPADFARPEADRADPAGQARLDAISLKKSVAILPFRVHGSAEPFDPLGTGLAEEIELAMGKLRTMSVSTTRSTLPLTKRGITIIEMASELGVRFLVDGVIRHEPGGSQVTILAIDGSNGHQVWSHTQDAPGGLASATLKEAAFSLAQRLHSKIESVEIESGLHAADQTDDPRLIYWKANALLRTWEREAVLKARVLCDRLLELLTPCSYGEAMASFCHAAIYTQKWSDDPEASLLAARRHYQTALRLDGNDALVMGFAAGTLALIGEQIDTAERLISRALEQLPDHQPTLFWGGWIDLAVSNPARALERFSHSLSLNPDQAVRGHTICGMGIANLLQGNPAAAREALFEARMLMPRDPLTLAALTMIHAMAGETAQARDCAAQLQEVGGVSQATTYFRDPAYRAMLETMVAELTAPA